MIILLFQSMILAAVDLSDLLNRALERDLQLQRLVLALENQELKLKQEKATRGPQLPWRLKAITLSPIGVISILPEAKIPHLSSWGAH